MEVEGGTSPLDWASNMTRKWEDELNIQKAARLAQETENTEEDIEETVYSPPKFMEQETKQFESELNGMFRQVKEKNGTVEPAPIETVTFLGDEVDKFNSEVAVYLGEQKMLSRAIGKIQNKRKKSAEKVSKMPVFLEKEVKEFVSLQK